MWYHVEFGTGDALLTAVATAKFLVGIALVLLGDATITTVGIVLVTLSAVVFLVDAKDLLVRTDRNVRDRPDER